MFAIGDEVWFNMDDGLGWFRGWVRDRGLPGRSDQYLVQYDGKDDEVVVLGGRIRAHSRKVPTG